MNATQAHRRATEYRNDLILKFDTQIEAAVRMGLFEITVTLSPETFTSAALTEAENLFKKRGYHVTSRPEDHSVTINWTKPLADISAATAT